MIAGWLVLGAVLCLVVYAIFTDVPGRTDDEGPDW